MVSENTVKYHLIPSNGRQLPSCQCQKRCPKLSRYKLMGVIIILSTIVFIVWSYQNLPLLKRAVICFRSTDPFNSSLERIKPHGRMHSPHTRRRLPQCLIIGVRKAGSRALLNFLNLHSKIQTARREVHFFDHDNNYSQGYDWYRQQMPYTFKDQITIEKSPSYFVVKGVPERVYQMNSTIRLLLIVREPVARAVSDYLQIRDVRLNRGKVMEPFEMLAINNETGEINRSYNAIKRSVYHRHLQKWLHFFDLDQIHIIDGDNLVKKPWEEMYFAEEFLGLEHEITKDNFVFNSTRGFFCTVLDSQPQHCLSQGKGRPHPAIDRNVLKKLKDFFRPLNEKFFHMVGRRFNW